MGNAAIPENYIPIILFFVIAGVSVAGVLLVGSFLRPSRSYRAKLAPYESGSPLFSDARIQFPMRYYIIAMLFVIFDIEVIFMVPWAVRFQSLGLLGLIEMLVFLGILLAGFWYAWKKGALEWD
ncbi:MAG: NAD(P)H-quinone oxidoreductase subunit 3 [Nitrospiraceae bacterium]|jgi:NADH-quinone oxidoreductase subunit A|nr:NAD(P)H-quinone oxidoreductase subunit 3 [Nitrospiraceae bacterium]